MTPRCSDERRLGAYVDGELAGRIARRVEQHVERCPACRREVQSLRELHDALRTAATPPPVVDPEVFRTRVLHRIRAGDAARARASERITAPWFRNAAWALPLLAAAVLGLALARHQILASRAHIVPTVQIELENPSVVPIIDVREDGIPVIWLARGGEEPTPPNPG